MKAILLSLVVALSAYCIPASANVTQQLPKPIGYDGFNPSATQNLRDVLSKTARVTIVLHDNEYTLEAEETTGLLTLLEGVKASTPRCAPADCFYMNLQQADGTWLMSLPVQNTSEGIVLLYLKLQENNAGVPLQSWWKAIYSRIGF